MSDGMSWYFELVDRITGPARKMEQSLQAVTAAAKRSDQATRNPASILQFGTAIRNIFGAGAEGQFYKGARRLGDMLERLDKVVPLDVIQTVGPSLMRAAGGLVTTAAGVVLSIATGIAVAVGAVAAGAATLGALGLKFAAESAEFKRNTLFG